MKPLAIILEDEHEIRDLLEFILKEAGLRVKAFPDPRSFLSEEKETMEADFMIADNHMPYMKGLDLIEHLKNNNIFFVKHVAVISGSWTEEDLEKARALGCRTISKPFGMFDIIGWIESCEGEFISQFLTP
ncbi:MAG: response regulator [Nitrospirae bacterium]|nr:response regulator [Nitrospirota bacterium]